ncbi:hypothetical protein [Microbacterium sp. 1.5R]|uniref:hypothetical protein n=1 Tax=Microbacterium sp. 1.5R TaxID=1916917 RepID=UPI0011A7F3D7|nr:hypothetical protein [Microbacterium sp. 1.5R]
MLQNSSITQGGLRVASPNGILAQSVAGGGPAVRVTGLRIVDGVLRITGTIDGDGVFEWSGSIDQEGATNLRGPVAITGQSGTLTVDAETLLRGVTKMLADLRVESGGRITAGNVIVEPDKITVGTAPTAATLQNGELALSNGARVAVGLTGGTSSIGLLPGGSADISANTLTAWLRATGATVSVTTAQARIAAPTIILDSLPTGAPSGAKAVLVDPASGKLYRTA